MQIQRDIVGRKVSDIILQNSQAYSIELKRVSDFKLLLEDSHQICCISRRSLNMSEHLFIFPTVKLIKKQIKKLHLVNLFSAIKEIKAFNNSTNQIVDLINVMSCILYKLIKELPETFITYNIYFKRTKSFHLRSIYARRPRQQ